MKYNFFLIGLILVLSFFSCKKSGEETAIEPDNNRAEISDMDTHKQVSNDSSQAKNVVFNEAILLDLAEDYELDYDPELMKDYLGTWFLLNVEEKVDESKSCLTIFPEGKRHRFKFSYYSSESTGTVLITKAGTIKLLKDGENFIPFYAIVGKPFVLNDKQTILLDSEGPLGFFQLE